MTISRIRGDVDARYAKWFNELTSGNVAVQSSANFLLENMKEQIRKGHGCGMAMEYG
jgi:hypothetical protein